MNANLHSVDFWVKVAHIVQGFLTPVIAILIGIISLRIQRQQVRTKRQQAEIHHLQYRLALLDRRMKIFDATQELILVVLRDAKIEVQRLYQFLRETREDHFLFGPEIGQYLDKVYENGMKLHTIEKGITEGVAGEQTEIITWFNEQRAVAKEKFLKYIDFREP